MKLKKSGLFLGIILTLSLSACLGEEEQAAPQQMPPPLVAVHEVVMEDVPLNMDFQAVTQGSRAVQVTARVQSLILERLYTEGQYVEEGEVLFQLERNEYEARMSEAQAQFDQAERELNRIRPLYNSNAVSQRERDSAAAAYETAAANLRIAQINLDYCQIKAPVSGYTGMEEVTAGNLVSNGTIMTTINQTDPIFVQFSFPGTTYLQNQQLVSQGRLELPANNAYKATMRLVDGSMYDVDGLVTFVDSQVDQHTGVVKARAEFPNENDYVLPGQYVRIFLEGAVLKDAILIPQRAVILTQMGSMVMLVNEQGIVEMRPVQVNMNVGQMFLLDGGLNHGERIIVDGIVKAKVGSPVTIAPADGAAPQGTPPNGQAPANAEAPANTEEQANAETPDGTGAAPADENTDENPMDGAENNAPVEE